MRWASIHISSRSMSLPTGRDGHFTGTKLFYVARLEDSLTDFGKITLQLSLQYGG